MPREAWKLVSNGYRGLTITLYLMNNEKLFKNVVSESDFHKKFSNSVDYFPCYRPNTTHIAPKESIGFFCFDSFDAAYEYRKSLVISYYRYVRIMRVTGYYPRKNRYMSKYMFPLSTNPFECEIEPNKKRKNTITECKIPNNTLLFDKIHIVKEV